MESMPALTTFSKLPPTSAEEDDSKFRIKPFKAKNLEMKVMPPSNEGQQPPVNTLHLREMKSLDGASGTGSSPDSTPSTATIFPHEPATEIRGLDIDFEDLRYTTKTGIIRKGTQIKSNHIYPNSSQLFVM